MSPDGRARARWSGVGTVWVPRHGWGSGKGPQREPAPARTAHRHPPPQGSLLRGQLPPFLNGFFQSSGQVLVRVMGTVSDVLHRLGAHSTEAQGLSIAINTRSFFDDVSAPGRGGHPISWPSSTFPGSLP